MTDLADRQGTSPPEAPDLPEVPDLPDPTGHPFYAGTEPSTEELLALVVIPGLTGRGEVRLPEAWRHPAR